jgi:Glycosyl transferases group 1
VTVIDVAGGPTGGAARWRREADEWVATHPKSDVRLIGEGHRVEPRWLARRELLGRRERRIAANNVSFVTGCGRRVVMLVNSLHFLLPGEIEQLPGLPHNLKRQVTVVRVATRRASVVVVPSSRMAERVAAAVPSLISSLVVRHHPLTVRKGRDAVTESFLLYPSIPAPHKDLVGGLRNLVGALDRCGNRLTVKVTAPRVSLGDLSTHPLVEAIGPQDVDSMDLLWSRARAAYVPYTVESFGYPLAEARAVGVPVIAVGNSQNREIAGKALVAFTAGAMASLVDAVALASQLIVEPDPLPFAPDAYFSWLTSR